MSEFEPTIGLEVHVQIGTESKLFCACPARSFGAPANSHICPVCTGQPGVLPVLNRKAVEYGVRAALALDLKVRGHSVFARKNYFYPDLPKAYQISQYEKSFSEDGGLDVGPGRRIGIQRIHLEEDAGKLLHAIGSEELPYSLVDLNRAGVPLMEIVSKPDILNADEAYAYLTELKRVLQFMGVSNCDMEKGEMRCDANVSIKPKGSATLGTRAEIKNLNSFKAVKEAIVHEQARQEEVLRAGGKIVQETRLWDDAKKATAPMRSKEEAHDYRYFADPDLIPLEIAPAWLEEIRSTLPERPQARKERLVKELGLSEYDAGVLTASREKADLFEALQKRVKDAKLTANWIINQHEFAAREAGKDGSDAALLEPLAAVVLMTQAGLIGANKGKEILIEAYKNGKDPKSIVEATGAAQVSDDGQIRSWANEAIAENAAAAADYRSGKEAALGRIVGAVMKKSKGKANPAVVNTTLKELLKS